MPMNCDDTEPGRKRDVLLQDLEPAATKMQADVMAGLRRQPKSLPSQYLYDALGAQLFEQICELPEYYPTRTEAAIMHDNMAAIAKCIGPDALVIEPGSGDGRKSKLLLAGLAHPAGYMPIDISRTQLIGLANEVSGLFPELEVIPVCADFTDHPNLPQIEFTARRNIVFLPGSTIGNFHPDAAEDLLRQMQELAGTDGGILIGVDLAKSAKILEPAYDDARGISRDFARNYLTRLNRELGADFDLGQFDYEAPYNQSQKRIEMSLISRRDQTVHIGDEQVHFAQGERVLTEHSYKYDLQDLAKMGAGAGLRVVQVWTDAKQLFSVQFLVVT